MLRRIQRCQDIYRQDIYRQLQELSVVTVKREKRCGRNVRPSIKQPSIKSPFTLCPEPNQINPFGCVKASQHI